MEKMWTLIKKFAKEEEGMEMVEYAVVGALVVAATAAIWISLGGAIQTGIQNLIANMSAPAGS